jgi:Xaa-Pro aminopeptidase
MDHDARLVALQQTLAERGLAGALLFQSRDVFYYTGTAQPGWLAVRPDEAVLFVASGLDFAQRDTGWGEDRLVEERRLEAVCRRMFPGAGRGESIGIELDVITAVSRDALAACLAERELIDISPQILAQRAIKDAQELELLGAACRALDAGHQAALRHWRPGQSELELSAALENGHRLAGHEGGFFIRQPGFFMSRGPFASGPNIGTISGLVFTISGVGLSAAIPAGASRRIVEAGDLVVVDIPTSVGGYMGDQSRTYRVGSAAKPDGAKQAHAALRQVSDAVIAAMVPGRSGGELYAVATRAAAANDIADAFLAFPSGARAHFIGHGVGLEGNEPPFLVKGGSARIAANTVLTVEIHVCLAAGLMVKLEDMVVVEEGGGRLLTITPRELIQIG